MPIPSLEGLDTATTPPESVVSGDKIKRLNYLYKQRFVPITKLGDGYQCCPIKNTKLLSKPTLAYKNVYNILEG